MRWLLIDNNTLLNLEHVESIEVVDSLDGPCLRAYSADGTSYDFWGHDDPKVVERRFKYLAWLLNPIVKEVE